MSAAADVASAEKTVAQFATEYASTMHDHMQRKGSPTRPLGKVGEEVQAAAKSRQMKKRNLLVTVGWNIALVGGPVVIGLILGLNGWTWANSRLILLALYAGELFLIWPSGWGPQALSLRGRSYASLNATAFDDVYAPPDRADIEEAQTARGVFDPITVGPAIAAALLLLSFAIWR